MADQPDSGPTWEHEYHSKWAPAYEKIFSELKTIPVKVLSFGPNPQGSDGDKRRQLAEHMQALENVDVAFPEEIQSADDRFRAATSSTFIQEEMMIDEADLVVGYQADSRESPGLQAEVTKFEDYPHVMDKMRFFVPRGYERRSGLASEALRRVAPEKKFPYTPAQLLDCTNMRSQSERWVDEARSRKFWNKWRSDRPLAPPLP